MPKRKDLDLTASAGKKSRPRKTVSTAEAIAGMIAINKKKSEMKMKKKSSDVSAVQ